MNRCFIIGLVFFVLVICLSYVGSNKKVHIEKFVSSSEFDETHGASRYWGWGSDESVELKEKKNTDNDDTGGDNDETNTGGDSGSGMCTMPDISEHPDFDKYVRISDLHPEEEPEPKPESKPVPKIVQPDPKLELAIVPDNVMVHGTDSVLWHATKTVPELKLETDDVKPIFKQIEIGYRYRWALNYNNDEFIADKEKINRHKTENEQRLWQKVTPPPPNGQKMTQLSIDDKNQVVWGISNTNLYKRKVDASDNWKLIAQGNFNYIDANGRNHLWALDVNNKVQYCLRKDDPSSLNNWHNWSNQLNFDSIHIGTECSIDEKPTDECEEYIWGVQKRKRVYKKKTNDANDEKWQFIRGYINKINVKNKKMIFGVSSNDPNEPNKGGSLWKCVKPCEGNWGRINLDDGPINIVTSVASY